MGGVLSGLGKGLVTCSIGKMLEVRGYKVTVIKCDPYLNVDAGTMNPYIHGEREKGNHRWGTGWSAGSGN